MPDFFFCAEEASPFEKWQSSPSSVWEVPIKYHMLNTVYACLFSLALSRRQNFFLHVFCHLASEKISDMIH